MLTNLSDLRESNEFLNLLLDNINSAVLIADENMKIHQFNKSFLSLFDRATDQLVDASMRWPKTGPAAKRRNASSAAFVVRFSRRCWMRRPSTVSSWSAVSTSTANP